jgi:hypothetical protein
VLYISHMARSSPFVASGELASHNNLLLTKESFRLIKSQSEISPRQPSWNEN